MLEKAYYLPFSVFPGIGPKRFGELLTFFHTAKAIWEASESDLAQIIGKTLAKQFAVFKQTFSLDSYLEELEKAHVWFMTPEEENYPSLLQEVPNRPFVLYGKGEKDILPMHPTVGIVGTRKISNYGRQVTQQFTSELVQAGCVIISGLAMGVDALAHQTTIEYHGKTIAVLGCGVDVCYPSSNKRIYQQIIASGGAIVSEYPLHMPPSVGSFPSRNRIIAGLSEVLLVTEGAEDSGALITAKDTFGLNRTVFAVPGPITSSLSKGTNLLIHQGARVALKGEDILNEFGIKGIRSINSIKGSVRGKTEEEQKVIDLLMEESLSLDELVRKTKLSVSQVSLIVSTLELSGVVKDLHGTYTLDNLLGILDNS